MAIVIVAFIGGVFYLLIWMTCNLLTVRKVCIQNDDRVAKALFVELLNSAERTLLVRDDGDRSSTLYYDDDIVEQVRSRLKNNPRLVIRVLFNYREVGNKLAVLAADDAFEQRDRLTIRYRPPTPRPAKEVHFKIVDNGRRGCLSRHAVGAQARDSENYDCSQSWLGGQFVFRRRIADFKLQFQNALGSHAGACCMTA